MGETMSKIFTKVAVFGELVVALLVLSSCSYLGPSDPTLTSAPELTPQQKAQLSYESVQQSVFVQSCTSCHGSLGGINLETYENVKRNLSAIQRSVFETKTMPKGQSLSREQLATLKAWIDLGAPEKAGQGNPTPTPDPTATPEPTPEPTPSATPEALKATFESIKQNILTTKCIYCHSGSGQAKHIPIDSVDALINSPRELVIPGNADESGLVLAIEREDDKRMPPPNVGKVLSDEQKEVIREWITNGASD